MSRLKINVLLLVLSAARLCQAQVQYFSIHLGIEELSSIDSPGRLTCVDIQDNGTSSFKLVQPCPQTGLWELEPAELDEQGKSKF